MARANNTLEQRQLIDVPDLDDQSGGTADDTIAAAGGAYNQANENAFRASMAKKMNDMLDRLRKLG